MNADLFLSVLLILLFVAWFYGPWQETCADYARQIVFEQRDKLFDLAADGGLNFKSHEYKDVRSSLNSAIRFAHNMTIARALYIFICYKIKLIIVPDEAFINAATGIRDDNVRKAVEEIERTSFEAIAISMLARSLVFISICVAASPLLLLIAYLYYLFVGFSVAAKACSNALSERVVRLMQIESQYESGKFLITRIAANAPSTGATRDAPAPPTRS